MLAGFFQAVDGEVKAAREPILPGRHDRRFPGSFDTAGSFGDDLDGHGKRIARRRIEGGEVDLGDLAADPIQAGYFLAALEDNDGSILHSAIHCGRPSHPVIKGLGHAGTASEDDVVITDSTKVFVNDVIRTRLSPDHFGDGASPLKILHISGRNAVELQKKMARRKNLAATHDATSVDF